MNNAVAINLAEEGEPELEKIETYATALIDLELELYEKYGAGGDDQGGGTPSSKKSWSGSPKQASSPSGVTGQGKRPSEKQRNVLIKYVGWTPGQIDAASYEEWKSAMDAHFDS